MKNWLCALIGLIGGAIAALFGGWDTGMITLVLFMAIDYTTGLIVAGVFHKSGKSKNGSLDSKAGWKGLIKKGMILVFVFVGYRLDVYIGTDYIRNAVIIGFVCNELISIIENAGLMGVPIPEVIVQAIDILKAKKEEK